MSINSLKAKYAALRPEVRKRFNIMALAGAGAVAATAVYIFSPLSNPPERVGPGIPQKAAVSVDSKMLEKSTAARLEGQDKENSDIRTQLKELRAQLEKGKETGAAGGMAAKPGQTLPQNLVVQNQNMMQGGAGVRPSSMNGGAMMMGADQPGAASTAVQNRRRKVKSDLPPLPPPADKAGAAGQKAYPLPPSAVAAPKEVMLGSIGHARNEEAYKAGAVPGDGKKKEESKRTVYLPPSFMAAHLLTGLNAPVVQGGKSNPVPVLIRVAAPAQLPNEVKMDLAQCFVVAEGQGDLAQERALVRTVSLSCLSKDGHSVIDQPITGFVQDADSKPGLAGRVVAKFGSTIAYAFASGLISGIGNGASQAVSSTTTSPLGATTITGNTLKDIGISGLGKGLSTAGEEISKFYMELAKMSMPVIEVGNGKKVTVVITKGVNIEIKDYPTTAWY